MELLQNRSDKLNANENGNIINLNLANNKFKKNTLQHSSSANSIIKKEVNSSKKSVTTNQRTVHSRSTNGSKLELSQSINKKESGDSGSSKESIRIEPKKELSSEKINDNHLNGYSNRCGQQSPRYDSLGLKLPLTPNGNL